MVVFLSLEKVRKTPRKWFPGGIFSPLVLSYTGSHWSWLRFRQLPVRVVVWRRFACSPLPVGLVKRECAMFMRLQTGQNLLSGPLIDRTVVVTDEREAGEGQRSEEAGNKTISRFPSWAVLVDGAADLAQ